MLWVKGSGGDLRTAKADGFASLYLDRVRAMKPRYLGRARARAEDAHRRPDVRPLRPLRVQPEPARLLDRYSAAHLRSLQARGPPPSERGDRGGGVGEPGAALPGDLRRRRGLRPLAASRLRPRPPHRIAHPGEAGRPGRASRPPRHELVERRRQGLLRDRPRDRRSRRGLHRGTGPRRAHLRGPAPCGRCRSPSVAACSWRSCPGFADGSPSTSRLVATVQDDPKTLRFTGSVDGPRLAALGTSCPDHFLRTKIKPLFADWDPASRDLEALKAALSEGLERYRRDYAAYYDRRKRKDSPAMRDANPTVVLIPGPGHDRVGEEQERVADHRGVLQLRHRGDARRRGHRPVRGHGRAGGLRHRVLVARGGEAAPPASREGARPADRRGGGGGGGNREGHRPSPGEGRRARGVRGPRPRGRRRDGAGDPSPSAARESGWRARGSAAADPPSASPATSRSGTAWSGCSARWCSPMEASTRWS